MPRSPHLLRLAKSAALLAGRFTPAQVGLLVLLYHRVGEGNRNIDLPIDVFREQMAFLAAEAEVVTLADGLARTADPRLNHDLVAVTFDDGTADFFDHAFPVLAANSIPATLYLCTGPAEEGLVFPSWATGTIDASALSWSQVREVAESGLITIGSHTHTHADLDRASRDTIEDELRRSKDLIEQRLGRPCPDFAYPHAVTSSDAERAVARCYSTAAIGGWRKNRPGALDPYRITRVPVSRADGPAFFPAKVRGRMGAEALMYRIGGTRRG
jgi:peptidoglycan/xylan/chitin deacetylase (PgdA/CDA1 family)